MDSLESCVCVCVCGTSLEGLMLWPRSREELCWTTCSWGQSAPSGGLPPPPSTTGSLTTSPTSTSRFDFLEKPDSLSPGRLVKVPGFISGSTVNQASG